MHNKAEKQIILIVDDVPENIHVLAELLNEDYDVKIATNGKDALRIANSRIRPDLILLDVMMPEMNGYEVLDFLKKNNKTKDIPVIFITVMKGEDDESKGLELGAIDYITKPYNASIVKTRIKNHLELKKYRDVLKETSMIDGLTGISNRRRFEEELEIEFKRAIRKKDDISLLMVDVDFFKLYNDNYGHLKGDECLRKIAVSLKNSLKRPGDLVVRWGGEEFVCLLPSTNYEGALTVAKDIQENLQKLKIEHKKSKISAYVTVSIGVSSMRPEDIQQKDNLIKEADINLYEAKRQGRNKII